MTCVLDAQRKGEAGGKEKIVLLSLRTGLFGLSIFKAGRRRPCPAPKFTHYKWTYSECLSLMVMSTNSRQRKQLVRLGLGYTSASISYGQGLPGP